MIRKLTIAVGVLVLLQSCEGGSTSEWQGFTNSETLQWEKSDIRTFKVIIDDPSATYDVSLGLRHVNGYQFETFPVTIAITGDNFEFTEKYAIQIAKNGAYLAEVGFDLYDREEIIVKGMKFPSAGEYRFAINHELPQNPAENVMELGLIINKVS